MHVLEEISSGEIIVVNDLRGYPEKSFKRLGECDRVLDGHTWNREEKRWVPCEKLRGAVDQTEWNRLPKAVRSYMFLLEARVYQLEQLHKTR